MKRSWAEPEHIGKICVSVIDVLSREFHIESKKPRDEQDYDKLIRIGGAIGYQAMNYNSLQKSHEFAARMKTIEKKLQQFNPEEIAMQHSPVLKEEETLKAQAEFR
jgi:hypothetical protein